MDSRRTPAAHPATRAGRYSTGLTALSELREKPSGTLRITTFRPAANAALLPMIADFLAAYPQIKLEIIIDEGLADIVADRYDAGIGHGHEIDRDMIAVRSARI